MSEEPDSGNGARSSFHLEISLSIGYSRRRARLATELEANVTSIVLLLAGAAVAILFVYGVLARLGAFSSS